MAQHWGADLDNAANKQFVTDYRKKYHRTPSFYAAQAYDAVNLINSAVVAVDGDLGKKDAMRMAMEKANDSSVRGPYRYGQQPLSNSELLLARSREGCRWRLFDQNRGDDPREPSGSPPRPLPYEVRPI